MDQVVEEGLEEGVWTGATDNLDPNDHGVADNSMAPGRADLGDGHGPFYALGTQIGDDCDFDAVSSTSRRSHVSQAAFNTLIATITEQAARQAEQDARYGKLEKAHREQNERHERYEATIVLLQEQVARSNERAMAAAAVHDDCAAPALLALCRESQEVNARHAGTPRQAERSRRRANDAVEDASGVPPHPHHDVVAESNEEALRWDAQDLARRHQQPAYAMPSTPLVPVARRSTIFSGVAQDGRIVFASPHSTGGEQRPPPPIMGGFGFRGGPAGDRQGQIQPRRPGEGVHPFQLPSSPPASTHGAAPHGPRLALSDERNYVAQAGKSWFPKGTVPTFTGPKVGDRLPRVDDAATNAMYWAKEVKKHMQERHISPEHWVRECISCLSHQVIDKFRASHCLEQSTAMSVAMGMRLMPYDFNGESPDPLSTIPWNNFCNWLITTYVSSSHLEQLQTRVSELGCAGVHDVEAYVEAFNETCIYADYLSKQRAGIVALGDIAAVLDGVDTAERRRIFRNALPSSVASKLQAYEAVKRAEDREWSWSLGVLQDHAISVASVLAEAKVRGGQQSATVNHIQSHEPPERVGALDPALAHVLNAQLHVMNEIRDHLQMHGPPRLTAGDDDPMTIATLHVKISEVMPDPPSQELIQERLKARACLACGEKLTHTKFTECPKLRAMHGVADQIDRLVAAERTRRPGPRRQARVHHLAIQDGAPDGEGDGDDDEDAGAARRQ